MSAYWDTEEFRQKVKLFKADARTCVDAIKAAGKKVKPDVELAELELDLDWLAGRT